MITDINLAWQELQERVATCRKCSLCETRNNTVFGEGPVENCKAVIIGEAPGEEEDLSGRPFVGKAGQLLTNILENGGKIPRDSLYITNVLKCRPPENRDPNRDEMKACEDHLETQLLLLRPAVVVCMGRISAQLLLNTKSGITSLRGEWKKWRGIDLFAMYHPSYLLRQENLGDKKRQTWDDVRALRKKLDELENLYN